MKKWLAIAGLGLLVALIVLWRQLEKSEASQIAPSASPDANTTTSTPWQSTESAPAAAPQPAAAAPVAAAVDPTKPKKIDPQSDEFFYKHDEIVIPKVMNSAVKCWENLDAGKRATFHRNQSIVIKFKQKVVNGRVTMHDGVIERSSINDPALEKCFFQQVLNTSWTNEELPDWEQEDTVKISPRVLKKYTRENREATGPDDPGGDVKILRGK